MSVLTQPGSLHEPEVPGLRTLYDLLAALTRAETIEEVDEAGVSSLLRATGADRAAILRFDPNGVMQFEAWRRLSPEYRRAAAGHTPWQPGERDAKPVLVPDVNLDPEWRPYLHIFENEGISALAFIPLSLDAGVFGKFMLYYSEPHKFSDDEVAIAQAIAGHVALAGERKRAESARLRTEQRLQAILDNAPAVIFVKDLEGRYALANRRHQQLFGMEVDSVIGKTDYDLFSKEVADRFRENDFAVLDRREPVITEEQAPHPDGIHTYVSVKFPLEGADGKVVGVCGIASDVTDRRQFEHASLQLAAIVESSDDAILSHDRAGRITSWNRAAETLYGYSAAEAIGQPVSLLADPDCDNEMPAIQERIWRGERVDHYETSRRRKDGSLIHVSLSVSPLRDASDRIFGASKIARDITDRRKAEQERAELLAREQAARHRAELLNQIGPTLVSEIDLEKIVQAVTDTARNLIGAEYGAFFHNVINSKGESYMLYTLSGAPREAFAKYPMPRNTALFGPTFRGEGIVRSDDIKLDPRYGRSAPHHGTPEGHLPLRSYLAAPVISRSGEVLGGLFFGHAEPGKFTAEHEIIVRGITAQAAIAIDNARLFERAQWIQNELKLSNEELRQANHDLETFAYSASHDLQEPLRTIAISAQLLERNCADQLSPDGQKFLANILKGSNGMVDLLRDLLAYTTATRRSEGPAPSTSSEAVVKQVLERLHDRILRAEATVTWDPLPVVFAHESRVAQVLQNLITNALKYRRQEAPRIHISAAEQDGWAVFSVTDNGIGIEPQYGDQIFGLFKRLHTRDRYPGSGIGLAICQRIVEQYGGRIWLEKSEPGEGSTFCFSIPSRT